MKKAEIIPAILPRDFAELEDKASLVQGVVKTIQIDVCDGQFVPNATWPYRKHDNNFDLLLSEDIGLPSWEEINYEFDLMVNNPEEVVMDWLRVGASRIIIHIESSGDISKAIDLVGGEVEIGLAINIETDIEKLEEYKDKIRFVQCMGIDRIGFQGQTFDDKVIEKIKSIHAKYPDLVISIDGGVSLDNAKDLIIAGATRLVVGSSIFDSDNVFDAVEKFKAIRV